MKKIIYYRRKVGDRSGGDVISYAFISNEISIRFASRSTFRMRSFKDDQIFKDEVVINIMHLHRRHTIGDIENTDMFIKVIS